MKYIKILTVVLVLSTIIVFSCGDSTTGPSGVTIGPGGGTASGSGVTVTFPAGALNGETEITFSDWSSAPSLPSDLTPLGQGVEIGPANLTMAAMTNLMYDVSSYTGSTDINDMAIYCYDEANEGWFWVGSSQSSDGNSIGGIIPFLGKVKPVEFDTDLLGLSQNTSVSVLGSNSATESSFDFKVIVKDGGDPVSGAIVEAGLAPYPVGGGSGNVYVQDGTTISAAGTNYTGRSESEGWNADNSWTTNANGEAICKIVLRDGSWTGYWIRASNAGEETWITYLFWPDAGANDSEWTCWLPGGNWGGGGGGGGNNPPNTPSIPNPSNGATNVSINANLSWSCSDPDGDDLTYDIYFGTSSNPPNVETGHTSTTYDPGTLNYETNYYWKIVAEDEHGATTAGPVWSFTTENSGGGGNYPDSVVATIDVGDGPFDICSLPSGDYIYVINGYGENISVIRTSDNIIVATIENVGAPSELCSLPSGDYIYVTSWPSGSVYVIRTSDNTVVAHVSGGVGLDPRGICSLPSGDYVYVARASSGDEVSVIRTSDNIVVATIDVGENPHGICSLPSGDYVYVTNSSSDNVSVIRTSDNIVVETINVGDGPECICSLPSGHYVYVTNANSDNVSVIRTSDNIVVATINVGDNPQGICSLPSGDYIYVTNETYLLYDNVSVIRTSDNTVVATVGVGSTPYRICSLPSGDYIYVTNQYDDNVSVIH